GAKPDERIRTPMQWDGSDEHGGFSSAAPWQPFQNDLERVNVAAQTDDPDSLLSHYREMIRLRGAHPALMHGDYLPIESESRQVYAFLRRTDAETLLVIINLG